ncbi:pitrilysin family protein [Chryseolinea sp. H1M3-3]|uniref:M16 family metallopeptidase n=1 Tax=Chryseolinea sp. H1M3-3 TaxID=3034144 RepID=UPI0023ED97A4|nr:pitrilysin family protein [Chryseolinea sp. H1M3-3]
MLDRTIAPPFQRSTSFELIQPEKKTLKSGAEAYFVLGGTQEVSKVEIIFPAGRWVEKVWGAAYFASNLLSKGTKKKTSFEIAHLLDLYGAHLEIHPGLDHISVSIYLLNKNFEPAISLFLELLTESVLVQPEIDLLKSIYLQNLKVNYEKTSFQASRLVRKNLFGEGHPYGKELDEADVEKVDRDSLLEHYNEFFKKATILVSGKVSEKNQRIIENAFSSFEFNKIDRIDFTNKDLNYTRHVVAKEGSVQSSIRLAKRAISKTRPDYADALFLNHILGGYFGSRLMKNIREDKGLSYGISSSLHSLKHDGYLVIGADVNNENVELTFDEIAKELKRVRTEKIGEEELDIARNHFIGSLQLEITTSFAHADKIKNMVLFSLSPQYYQNMISRVGAITAEELLEVANRYFQEDSFVEIAVG